MGVFLVTFRNGFCYPDPMEPRVPDKTVERTLLLVLFMLVLFASPVMFAWATDDSPWYIPYTLWAGVVAAAAYINHRR